tara:strand:+ start:402 stop:1142 length:741 start_codon:yes stop_codon:yes gene_type:complete
MTSLKISFTKLFALSLVLAMTASLALSQDLNMKSGSSKAHLSPYGKVETNWYKIGWFADLNGGVRLLGATSGAANLGAGFNGNAGLGFFVTDKIGIKGRIDYNTFKFTPGIGGNPEAKGRMVSLSLEATSDLLPFTSGSKIRDWRIELHGGFGYSTFNNISWKENRLENNPDVWDNDPVFKGNDDMGHMIIGITPQYHINGRWSIQADFSSFFYFKQDFTFDNYNLEPLNGVGSMITTSFGVVFRP